MRPGHNPLLSETNPSAEYDVCIVGSGPNGLAAAALLSDAGLSVCVIEAADELGGGLRSAELTLPGFLHDVCSAAHPMGILSPYLSTLPLAKHGLQWASPPASVAHPLDDQPAVLLQGSIEDTARDLGVDGPAYTRLLEPFVEKAPGLLNDALAPIGIPSQPFTFARFGLLGLRSAVSLSRRFREPRARGLFAGCAGHSILPLSSLLTGGLGLLFAVTGHVKPWPVAVGGSQQIAKALVGYLEGRVHFVTGQPVAQLSDLPSCRAVLFDTNPGQLASIARDSLPEAYRRKLGRYRYGPGVFKIDWALDGPIPWRDPRCLQASTVHVGGTLEEIAVAEAAVWRGEHPERPFMMVVQQSQFDRSRAPDRKHTGYAYIHVPSGSTLDQSTVMETQLERFAPGFRDLVLARHVMNTADYAQYNLNYIGGAITGGVADIPQAFMRPVARLNPYATPNPHLYICSAATPPGGGVHGMCGFHAARSVLKHISSLGRLPITN